jgi:hypothetical protein
MKRIAILEHLFTPKQVSTTSTRLDHIIDDIDIIITNQQNAIEQDPSSNHSSYQFDKTNHEKQVLMINVIGTLPLHMIERAKYFKQN